MNQTELNDYWIVRTNQHWKLLTFMFLMFIGIASFIAMIMVINEAISFKSFDDVQLSLFAVFITFGSLTWFTQALKCPKCGYKPVWPILKSSPANEWLRRITKLEHCPSCKK